MHSNKNFDAPVKAEFYNCTLTLAENATDLGSGTNVCYVGNNGQGHNVRLKIVGCDMISLHGRANMMIGNSLSDPARDFRTQLPILTGHGNAMSVIHPQIVETLSFQSKDVNQDVSVTGGTAKSDIYGDDDFVNYAGTSDAYGVCVGVEAIQIRDSDKDYTLAYRLGDCALVNKTITIVTNGNTETVTFAENFQTNYASWNDAAIIAYINNQLTYCEAILNNPYSKFSTHFTECITTGYNSDTKTVLYGMPLTNIAGNKWEICQRGKTPDGIALERMNPGESGTIGLIGKSMFQDLYGLSTTAYNTGVSVGDNGAWVVDSDNPIMIAAYNNAFKLVT